MKPSVSLEEMLYWGETWRGSAPLESCGTRVLTAYWEHLESIDRFERHRKICASGMNSTARLSRLLLFVGNDDLTSKSEVTFGKRRCNWDYSVYIATYAKILKSKCSKSWKTVLLRSGMPQKVYSPVRYKTDRTPSQYNTVRKRHSTTPSLISIFSLYNRGNRVYLLKMIEQI
jgi:hypothetical protein